MQAGEMQHSLPSLPLSSLSSAAPLEQILHCHPLPEPPQQELPRG